MIANIIANIGGEIAARERVVAALYECGGVEFKFPGLYKDIEMAFGNILGGALIDAAVSRLPPTSSSRWAVTLGGIRMELVTEDREESKLLDDLFAREGLQAIFYAEERSYAHGHKERPSLILI